MKNINRSSLCLFTFILFVVFVTNSAFAITYINVQDAPYNAAGNGITDDTDAIQDALDTGNPVYFPAGTYKVSAALTYTGKRIASNGATIKADDDSFYILTVSNSDGLYIGDLRLEYPSEQPMTSGYHPLRIMSCSNFIIERVIIKNGGAMHIYQSDNGIVRQSKSINSCYKAFDILSSNDILIENCYAKKNSSAFSSEDSYNIKFIGNTAEDSQAVAVRVEDTSDTLVENNTIKHSKEGLVAYGPLSGSTIDTTDIEFYGNTLYECYKTDTFDFESYNNGVWEYAMATKMYVDYVYFLNNIVIGGDESTLLEDFSSSPNVVFNTGISLNDYGIGSNHPYYTLVPDSDFAYVSKADGVMPQDWLMRVNFTSGVDISEERLLTVDAYWGSGDDMVEGTLQVNLYSKVNGIGNSFICSIPMLNPYEFISMTCILRVPDSVSDADLESIKCIEFEKISNQTASIFTVADIHKGLKAKVGYFHSYYGSDVLDAVLDSNVFVDVDHSYLHRKRVLSDEPTIITGSGITGTTAQRPSSPDLNWHYYDTDLDSTVYWDGSDWIDINTYWLDNMVSAVHFDGTNYVSLGNDDRVSVSNYTIEGWIKATTNNTERYIIERNSFSSPYGYLLSIYSDNNLYGYQSVAGNFYTAMVYAAYPDDNEFHHVAMTCSYNGTTTTMKLYIDGVLKATNSATGAPDYPPASAEIKAGNGFVGTIDKVKFYGRTLSSTEIANSYEKFKEQQYAYWRFDEGSGSSAYDSSPYGSEGTTSNNVGTLNNMNTSTCWVTGKQGKGLIFADGINDYVDLGNPAWLNVNNYTISGWVKTTNNSTERYIISRNSFSPSYGYLLSIYSDNKLYGYQSVAGNFYTVMVSAAFPDDNAFHHVAMTFSYDGTTSTLKIYIDGVLKATNSATGAPDTPATSEVLKAGKGFVGTLDEIKFHTRTLNSEEIAIEYNKGGKW